MPIAQRGSIAAEKQPTREEAEEPFRGFVHGDPGTDKSKRIRWISRLVTEALGWEHGRQFLCVAFQNRVAHAMGGTTLHTRG